MADSNVPITAGTGTNVDTRTTPGGEHRQVMTIGNDGDVVAGMTPVGALDVNIGFATQIYDAWSGTSADTNKWIVTGTAPTLSNGTMTMSTAAGYHAIRSREVILPNAGLHYVANGIALEATAAAGAGRFWGFGTPVATPGTVDVLVQDGIGFQVMQSDGSLRAVTYAGGVRTDVATLARPGDAATHRMALYFRVTTATWHVDNIQINAASASWPAVNVVELPALIVRQNTAAAPAGVVFTNAAHLTATTAQPNMTMAGAQDANLASTESNIPITSAALTAVSASTLAGTTSVAGAVVSDVSAAGNISFHLVATAFVGTVVFEQSYDPAGSNGTWAPVPVLPEDGTSAPMSTLAINTAVAYVRQFTTGMFGPALFRVRASVFTSGALAVLLKPGPGWVETQPALAPSNANIGTVGSAPATTGTVTAAALAIASFTVLASNASRKSATFYNDSVNILYLALAATASTTAYTVQVPAGGYYELPGSNTIYTGIVTGIATVASGNCRVTELT